MTSETYLWRGASGGTYQYIVYGLNTSWNQLPGNYIFAKRLASGGWQAIYVGETSDFSTRITASHEKWGLALLHGVTHIHALVNHGGSFVRREEELDLIRALNPPYNR